MTDEKRYPHCPDCAGWSGLCWWCCQRLEIKAHADERQKLIEEIMKHHDCSEMHRIVGEPWTCLDIIIEKLKQNHEKEAMK